MIPDGEKVIGQYLREHPDVAALGTRLVSKWPDDDDVEDSWVMMTEIDASQDELDPSDYVVEYVFQFDCYAGAQGGIPEAKRIARTIRGALTSARNYVDAREDGGVMVGARVAGWMRLPDEALKDEDGNPRQRMVLTILSWMHS